MKIKNSKLKIQNYQEGQVLIIIILTLLVVSLVVLAVASRSITDVNISNVSDESARAFSAAEAGVEEAVQDIRQKTDAGQSPVTASPVAGTLPNQASYSYEIGLQGGDQSFLSSTQLSSDLATFQVYLERPGETPSDYTANDICVLWGNKDTTDTPSLEATVVYRDPSGIITNARALLSAAAGTCTKTILAANNNLGIDRTFQYSNLLTLPGTNGERIVMRIRLLGNLTTAHYVGVTPQGAALPSQGYKITSIGTSQGSAGTSGAATRKVEVFQAYPAVPAIFDFALYNHSGQITK